MIIINKMSYYTISFIIGFFSLFLGLNSCLTERLYNKYDNRIY